MTTTLQNLLDETLMNLQGFTYKQDRTTYLTTAILAGDLVIPIASAQNIGVGIIEIDQELMWVDRFDLLAGTMTVAPWGRGYNGTVAVSHLINAKVVVAPSYPQKSLRQAINDVINSVYPRVFAIGYKTLVCNPSQTTYQIPSEAKSILNLSWQSIGPTQEWNLINRYRLDADSNQATFIPDSTDLTISKSLTIYTPVFAGRNISVVYTKQPTAFTNVTDVFETVTGLPSTMRDVIIYGAVYRLMSFIDPARIAQTSASSDELDSKRPYGSGGNATKQIFTLYQQRLEEESLKQKMTYPIRPHYLR